MPDYTRSLAVAQQRPCYLNTMEKFALIFKANRELFAVLYSSLSLFTVGSIR